MNPAALLAQFPGSIIGLVISVFLARNLGAVAFGKKSFAFTAIFAVSSSSDIARCRSEKLREINHKQVNTGITFYAYVHYWNCDTQRDI